MESSSSTSILVAKEGEEYTSRKSGITERKWTQNQLQEKRYIGHVVMLEGWKESDMRAPPNCPVGFTSHAGHAVNPGIVINFEVGTTHYPFTVNPGHCLHLVHRMFKAPQPSLTVEHTPCIIHPANYYFYFISFSHFLKQMWCQEERNH